MADDKKKSGDKGSSSGLDASSGNIWVRSMKLLLERLGKKAGEKLGSTGYAQTLYNKVEAHVGSKDLNRLLEGAAFIGPVLLQDTIFARLIQRGFKLNPDLARELSNEGLDSLLESFFDKVRTANSKGGKDQNVAIMNATREFEDEALAWLKAKHPELFEDTLHVLATNRAHKPTCTLVREGSGSVKRTLYEVQQLGGDMTHECVCVGANTDPAGSFQQAYRRLGLFERDLFDKMLMGPLADIRKLVLAHTGETRKVSTEDLRTVLYTSEELRKERLIAMLGIILEKSKSPLEMLSDTAKRGIETLSDKSKRSSFRTGARNSTSALGRTRSRIRNV